MQVYFYRWFLLMLLNHEGAFGTKFLLMTVLACLVDCISLHVTYWRQSTAVWVWMVALTCLQLLTWSHLLPIHPLKNQSVILQELKKLSQKTSSIQIPCRISCKMTARYVYITMLFIQGISCDCNKLQKKEACCNRYFKLVFLEI